MLDDVSPWGIRPY